MAGWNVGGGSGPSAAVAWERGLYCKDRIVIEFIKKLLMLLSGLRPAPVKNKPVLEVETKLTPWIGLDTFMVATGLSAAQAQEWYPHVRAACIEFSITAPVRLAAFLAQIGHESGGFVHTRELWGPTPAQNRYEGRKDLGNTQPGDGPKFRGRGLIQITGRDNYQKLKDALGVDVINNPALLEQRPLAARSAAWWWATNGCNEIADTGDFTRLTRRINGGTNGLNDRLDRWDRANEALA